VTAAGAAAKPQFSPDSTRLLITNAVLYLGPFKRMLGIDPFILHGSAKYAVLTIRYIARLVTAGTAERTCQEAIAGAQKMLK
jgi:hypothetical protein